MTGAWVRDAAAGGLAGAVLGGVPSTLHAVLTGRDPLEATYAAGRLLLPAEPRGAPLLAAAALAHGALSFGWALPIAAFTPRRGAALFGAAAGLAIAGLDLGVVGSRIPAIRALHQPAQVADHVVYGAVVAWVAARRRGSDHLRGRSRRLSPRGPVPSRPAPGPAGRR